MSKVKMSWDWVGEYPVFVYTTFVDHNIFKVKIVLGTKSNPGVGNNGPDAEPWMEYTQRGLASKHEVVRIALRIAKLSLYADEAPIQKVKPVKVWGAFLRTVNGEFNALAVSPDMKKIMAVAKANAINLKRMVFIKEVE